MGLSGREGAGGEEGVKGRDTGEVGGRDGPVAGLERILFPACKGNKLVTQWLQLASTLATLGAKNPQAAGGFKQPLVNSPFLTVVFKHFHLHGL